MQNSAKASNADALLSEAKRAFYVPEIPKRLRAFFRKPGRVTDRVLRLVEYLLERDRSDLQEFAGLHAQITSLHAQVAGLGARNEQLEQQLTLIRELHRQSEEMLSQEIAGVRRELAAGHSELLRLRQQTAMLQRRIFFLHSPKTAGTSVRLFFEQILRPEEILSDAQLREIRLGRPLVSVELAELLRSKRLVHSHSFDLNEALAADPAALLITFWRNPADQLVSWYDFFRSFEPGYVETFDPDSQRDIRLAQDGSFQDFVRGAEQVRNGQARNLFGDIVDRATEDFPEVFAECEAGLRRFHCIGITEEFRRSMQLLSCVLNVPWKESFVPRANVTEENSKVYPANFHPVPRTNLTASDREFVAEFCRLDVELYRRARSLFEEACARWTLLNPAA